MHLNALLPSTGLPAGAAALRELATGIEALGYTRLVMHDHVLGAVRTDRARPLAGGPYDETTEFHEPFVLASHLAATTTTLGFATNVLVLTQRQAALVAKQVMELDLLSDGRFALGVGIGWNWVEYEGLGVDFSGRGARLDEQVELIRRLWQEPVVTFDGHYHRVDRAGLQPRSGRTPEIWFGGYSRAAIERAARVGDGFMYGIAGEPTLRRARQLRDLLERGDRTAAGFGQDVIVDYSDGPDELRRQVRDWAEVGGTHVTLRTGDATADFLGKRRNDFHTVQQHLDAYADFVELMTVEIGPTAEEQV
jgi:probable F420-dependent oxidoreductase